MFRVLEEAYQASETRIFETRDIVRRMGIIPPTHIHIRNYPMSNPVTAFNASMILVGDTVEVYARVIFGYYMYVSAVVRFDINIEDLLSGYVSSSHYTAELVVYPGSKYDIWGVEDPRTYVISNRRFMTYCGRTINYFHSYRRVERTLPVTAVSKDGKHWTKCCVFTLHRQLRNNLISDKDAFIHIAHGKPYLFHRPHMSDEQHYLTISKFDIEMLNKALEGGGITEIPVHDTVVVLLPGKFEYKLGWSTPPIPVSNDEYLVLIHGVDKEMEVYRVFAALIKFENDMPRITAVTPYYIMEPKAVYEVCGDRPYVVFPCGIIRIDEKLIISYGAADFLIGFGEIDLSTLMSILDKNRLA